MFSYSFYYTGLFSEIPAATEFLLWIHILQIKIDNE